MWWYMYSAKEVMFCRKRTRARELGLGLEHYKQCHMQINMVVHYSGKAVMFCRKRTKARARDRAL